jgi:hypothetical protein
MASQQAETAFATGSGAAAKAALADVARPRTASFKDLTNRVMINLQIK